MITAMICGRLIKHPKLNELGHYVGSIAAFDGDRSVRIKCKIKHAREIGSLPAGTPITVSGVLQVASVLSDKGEPKSLLTLEVTTVSTI